MINKQGIKELFSFCQGRKVMLHSSYKAFGKVEGGPSAVVEAFIELTDLILFPTFTFQAWCHDNYWDQNETPSEMGIIGETARKLLPRSQHPIYSFAVYSKDHKLAKKYLLARNRESFDLGESPFAKFYDDGGLIVSIGPESHRDTFSAVHFAELKAGVGYRRIKEFYGLYKLAYQNKPSIRGFSMFVRSDINSIVTEPDPAIEQMIKWEAIRKDPRFIPDSPHSSVLYVAEMVDYVDGIEYLARLTPDLLRVERKFD